MSLKHVNVLNHGPAIICDTMIWKENISEDIKSKFTLAATWLSVIELFKASDRRVGVVLRSWEKLRDNSAYIIPLSPQLHFLYYFKREAIRPEEFDAVKAIAGHYDQILTRKLLGLLTDEQWKQFEEQVAELKISYDKDVQEWIEMIINSYLDNHSPTPDQIEFLENPKGIQEHLHLVTMPLIIHLFTGTKRENIPKIETDDFRKFELFTHVFNQWLIDLNLRKTKAKVNDLIDIFNMIYVTPIDKYWTKEKQWIKRIKKVGLDRYLFDADCN